MVAALSKTIAIAIYGLRLVQLQQYAEQVEVGCISDTHNKRPSTPHGDVLIHAGDLSVLGSVEEIQTQLN